MWDDSQAIYPVRLREDDPKAQQLKAEILAAPTEVQVEVMSATTNMEEGLVSSKDRYDTLDHRFETYALILDESPIRLLCDFDKTDRAWTVLALSTGPAFRNEVYREACQAHGLVNPHRAP